MYGASLSLITSNVGCATMLTLSPLCVAVVGLVIAASGVEAAPMNKCIVNGTVTYQQGPCPSNQVRRDPTLEELNAAEKKRRAAAASAAAATTREAPRAPVAAPGGFNCDGRQHCSQMRSCNEAKYFLANCPGVKMDGDRDGIPCEEQWCQP
ncbi:excalibur calcium-binding domain-containing protein [Methylibium sp.]|uniref:excalibur calcium-binding domain-containing protein n=1 Tax=Methylibium sp. TaxID=2067992 RepID=UPI003D0F2D18